MSNDDDSDEYEKEHVCKIFCNICQLRDSFHNDDHDCDDDRDEYQGWRVQV